MAKFDKVPKPEQFGGSYPAVWLCKRLLPLENGRLVHILRAHFMFQVDLWHDVVCSKHHETFKSMILDKSKAYLIHKKIEPKIAASFMNALKHTLRSVEASYADKEFLHD
jgi:hypothetical protein